MLPTSRTAAHAVSLERPLQENVKLVQPVSNSAQDYATPSPSVTAANELKTVTPVSLEPMVLSTAQIVIQDTCLKNKAQFVRHVRTSFLTV